MAKVLAVVVVVEPRNEQRREMLERCVDGDGGAADMRPFSTRKSAMIGKESIIPAAVTSFFERYENDMVAHSRCYKC
ncbi:hypothetical protein DY000_02039992 [Brassica cretica]|uniref:Kinesin motor domain-containing protein n=1 Tax=Brassica cretica TaxID=69181 RepID=A0ABQ7BHX0_BRACR|nr:hypothetical protein DY000_02039992 [Brassica cretica]